MIFRKINTANALGCILAHSLNTASVRVRKGTWLTQATIDSLLNDGVDQITVARLEEGDVHEDEAATRLANALSGAGIRAGKATTGRVNCYAESAGLLTIPRERLLACNHISDSITASTLPENRWVEPGKMVATIKIIPYAVELSQLNSAIAALSEQATQTDFPAPEQKRLQAKICVHKARPRQAHLVQTTQSGTRTSIIEKTEKVTARRLLLRNARLSSSTTCSHETNELSQHLIKLAEQTDNHKDKDDAVCDNSAQWILISGASAISDTNDVIPEAVRNAGGTVSRFGIPVDPGNLLLLGTLRNSVIIGIPGCARSPKHNGLDLFMDRLACDIPITKQWINSLAIGGLMGEIIDRPQPRARAETSTSKHHSRADKSIHAESCDIPPISTNKQTRKVIVTGLLMAAGMSRRFGSDNKLLVEFNSTPMILHSLSNLVYAGVQQLLLITGHENNAIESLCKDHIRKQFSEKSIDIQIVNNPDYASGMASSLKAGISKLIQATPDGADQASQGALICLADMPQIKPQTYQSLVAAAQQSVAEDISDSENQRASAFVPTNMGRRGNPVLLMSELFDPLLDITGDVGARHLLQANPDCVKEVAVNDTGIFLDFDTPAQLENNQ